MHRLITLLTLLLCLLPAQADSFYTLVGVDCMRKGDHLIIYYKGAYNEDGAAMVREKKSTEWEPGDLIASMKDDNHIGELRTVESECRLRHGAYQVRIGPTPGNYNIQGSCGASISAWVEVRRGNRVLLPRYELEGNCHDLEAPVTTWIQFRGRSGKPSFKKVLPLEFGK